MTVYPSENEIRRKLFPWQASMWFVSLFLLAFGVVVDMQVIAFPLENAFQRAGSLQLAIALLMYFGLERAEFLTCNAGNLFDSDNHYLPRKILAPSYMALTAIGTIVWGFGDIPFDGVK